MPVSKEELIQHLLEHFPDIDPQKDIVLEDSVGDQDHYTLNIKSASFIGKTHVQRHRMVMSALKELLSGKLHAISIKTEIKE